jgi:hypothetical protein
MSEYIRKLLGLKESPKGQKMAGIGTIRVTAGNESRSYTSPEQAENSVRNMLNSAITAAESKPATDPAQFRIGDWQTIRGNDLLIQKIGEALHQFGRSSALTADSLLEYLRQCAIEDGSTTGFAFMKRPEADIARFLSENQAGTRTNRSRFGGNYDQRMQAIAEGLPSFIYSVNQRSHQTRDQIEENYGGRD